MIKALEQVWFQNHGPPNVVRCDPEGCFRGIALSDYLSARGVELLPCAGEDHGQIGTVERLINKIKTDARTLLRSVDVDPYIGILHVVGAHNMLDRVGGYAPIQWTYGRFPEADGRFFEGGNSLPFHSTEGSLGTSLRANLSIRVQAEEVYRRSQAVVKLNRALNTKPRRHEVYLPGDLVYYRRFKTPSGQQPSHSALDQPRMGIARWYGPARVLATETHSEDFPATRKPGSIVWLTAAGRLKRCSPHQLRHCSEREKILAEASSAVSTPWSFTSLLHLVEKGQFEVFDDMVQDEEQPSFRERESQPRASERRVRSRSRGVSQVKRTEQEKPKEQGQEAKTAEKAQQKKRSDAKEKPEEDREKKKSRQTSAASLPPLYRHPQFQDTQRRAPDLGEWTLHDLLKAEKTFVVEDGEETSSVFHISVPLPEDRREIKKFVRDSTTWVSNKMKKGAELKWTHIPKHRLADFQKAKDKELSHWIQQSAVRLAKKQDVPPERVVRMRWLYTLKSDNSAKARLVIIGYEDPDLGDLHTTSPTMSRRTRGLFLTACATLGWTALKGDVRAAFLQGLESEKERAIFAKRVKELAEKLGGEEGDYVQILKACYGLANAPSQWHASISETMRNLGFIALQTEPCCWKLLETDAYGETRVVGLAVAHMDDFLFGGDGSSMTWNSALEGLYKAYDWSPWEADTYMHCGVQVIQNADGSSVLNHSKYCESIDQIQFKQRHPNESVTVEERQQLRAVLGALQWRVYQSAPQHGARLSALQSQLADPKVQTLLEANKLVREVYNNRHIGVKYNRLVVNDPMDVTFVAWCDAAVGNRRDLSSTGGYVIAATEPSILEGKPCPINMVSWKSGRLPRVSRSSLSAEIQAFSIAEEELMYVRIQWAEMMGHEIPLRKPGELLQKVPGVMVTDAKSLFDVIKKGPQNTSGLGLKEKYSVLDMLSVFQRLELGKTQTRWVHSEAQIADAMTKHSVNNALIRVLISGTWTLVHDENFVSSKNLRKRAKIDISAKDFGACESLSYLEPDAPPFHV